MAINKDSGDTRTYTADTLTGFQWRIPTTNTSVISAFGNGSYANWPGRIQTIQEANVSVFAYACTFTSNDAAVLAISNSSGSGFTNITNGHARSETFDHAQVPGMHFAAVNCQSLASTGIKYWKALHATDNSDAFSFNIASI